MARWQDESRNDVEARPPRAPVAGSNTKARVILKRAYGLRSAASLGTRFVLERNWAHEVVVWPTGQVQGMVAGCRMSFAPAGT